MQTGRAIKILREAKGLSLSALAKKLEISPAFLSMVEQNKKSPSLKLLKKISDSLNIPLETFRVVEDEKDKKVKTEDEYVRKLADSLKKLVSIEDRLKKLVQEEE